MFGLLSAAEPGAFAGQATGGVSVAAVMTWGSGVGVASDVLAGNVSRTAVRRLQDLG